MADITKYGSTASISTAVPPTTSRLPGLVAGETLAEGDVVYIKASDGKLYKALAENSEKRFAVGLAGEAASAGQPCTILRNLTVGYGSGLTPGAKVYVSGATAGAIADAATATYGTSPIGFCMDAKRIHFHFAQGV